MVFGRYGIFTAVRANKATYKHGGLWHRAMKENSFAIHIPHSPFGSDVRDP